MQKTAERVALRSALLIDYSGDQIKRNEMGGACGTYERQKKVRTGFWWGYPTEGVHLGDLGVDGRITLKWISKK